MKLRWLAGALAALVLLCAGPASPQKMLILVSPNIGGSISFDFQTQTYLGGETPQQDMPVVRNSTGYARTVAGTLTSFGPNVFRITDKGLLIESVSTNLTIQSQAFSGAGWSQNNTVTTDNTTVAPDGTTTAATLTDNSTNAFHLLLNAATPSFSNAQPYTASCYAKAGTDTRIQLTFANTNATFSTLGYVNFDLSSGTVVGSGGTVQNSGVEAYANGWYRVYFSELATASAVGSGMEVARINSAGATRLPAYVGTGTTVFVWGCQLENFGVRPSSLITTTTTSVTRPADLITGVGGRLKGALQASSGVATFKTSDMASTFTSTMLGINSTTIGLGKTSGNFFTSTWGSTVTNTTTQTWSVEQSSTLAWNATGTGIWFISQFPRGGTSAVSAATTESIGCLGNGTAFLNGYLEKLTVGPLTDNTTPAQILAVYRNQTFFTDFAATGLSTIDMSNTKVPGFKWYLDGPFPNSAITSYQTQPVQTASFITLNGSSGITIAQTNNGDKSLVTVVDNGSGGLNGQSFASGGYIEAVMAFDVTLARSADVPGSWPAFWSKGTGFLTNPSSTETIELDFWESFPTGTGTISELMGFHDAPISGGAFGTSNGNDSNIVVSIGSPTFNNTTFHTYGTLWIPTSINAGSGIIERFFDNVYIPGGDILYRTTTGAIPAAAPSNPNGVYSFIDSDPRFLILSAGSINTPQWPSNWKSVRALQQ